MYLQKLDIHGLRNLQDIRLSFSSAVNFLYGDNGSGKTSVLEAIYLLGRGRSFRTRNLRAVINRELDECTLFGLLTDAEAGRTVPIGVHRSNRGEVVFKVDGVKVNAASRLAEAMPLLLLNSDSYSLLEGGPQNRRQFIDWGVFHVEHRYRDLWGRFKRTLKQRNSLLRRDRIDPAVLDVWNAEFLALSGQISEYRARYIGQLTPLIKQVLGQLSSVGELDFVYYAGWDKSKGLAKTLAEDNTRDRQGKTTHHGPHRADFRIRLGSMAASEVLSRGQTKIVVSAMQIAQGFLYQQLVGAQCVYLLDDLPAELDRTHRQKIAELLHGLGAQVFITGVDKDELVNSWPAGDGAAGMFHVEQGKIIPE